MRPLNDNIVVQTFAVGEGRTSGGLYIPETANDNPIIEGIVVRVGPGKLLDNGTRGEMTLVEQDKVLFPKFNGTKVERNRETFYILAETSILAVMD